jgi:hypothetical protein
VATVQHEPPAAQTSTERLSATINRIRAQHGKPPLFQLDKPDDPELN